jgi:hypothetical protein
MHYENIHNLI